MRDPVTATELRQHVYRLLDRVLETGEPLEVVRKGQRLRIAPETPVTPVDQLARITPIPGLLTGDPGDLVETDWTSEWDPNRAVDP